MKPLAQLRRERLDVRLQDDRLEELARVLGPLRRGRQPALGAPEARVQQSLAASGPGAA